MTSMEQLSEERRQLQARLETDKLKIQMILADIREDLRPLELLGDLFSGASTNLIKSQSPALMLGSLCTALLPRKWMKHKWIGAAFRIFSPVLIQYLLNSGKKQDSGNPKNCSS